MGFDDLPPDDHREVSARGGQGSLTGNARKGFASMTPARRRALASLGGRAAHANGTAHQWTIEDAREAGRKGALQRHQTRPRGVD